MKLTMPLPGNRANARWHWTTEKILRDEFYLACDVMCRGQRKNRKRWDRVTIKATLYVWQLSDQDNLVARLKWPLDYLVIRRYILDDSPKVLEWVGMPEQEIDRKNQRVEIEINPIEGDLND
jgi:hypothetical protein